MDRHSRLDTGLFDRIQGRRVIGVELDEWAPGYKDWLGISFDGGTYLSLHAGGENPDGTHFIVGFKRRCPEPFRDETTGTPLRRCRGFQDHGGRHV